ncbi:helix-turn-helix domain-containing protein [Halobacteria archaeon AArc-dxtr1]|nr:helix-turn-helix domain-containing protein [Halobacteria archaeon AArc-dxtr1]
MAESGGAAGHDRRGLLPEHSVLSLEEYLAMQRSIGNETRFRVLDELVEEGPQSASELREAIGVRSNALHYHLDELVDVGLVENRKRKGPDEDGLYSYYRATALGEGILSEGVRELMAREWDSLDTYA